MKKRIYRIVKEKCGIPQVGVRWAFAVTMIAATLTVGFALAQRRPARFEQPGHYERLEREEQERHVLAEHRANLKNKALELREKFAQVKMELAELEESGKGESEKARALRVELREMEMGMARIERELHGLEGRRREREEMRPRPEREPPREILRRLEELGHETEMVLQRLTEQNFGRNDETNMLYERMRELNQQMQQVRQQLGQQLAGPNRPRRQLDELGPEGERGRRAREAGRQIRPEDIMTELGQLRELAGQMEFGLEQLGDKNPERAEKLRTELRALNEEIALIEMEREVGRRGLQEHARQLERRLQELGDGHPEEAQELRMQLDRIHRQMERIERVPDILGPLHRVEEPMQPGGEFHRQELMVRREQLQAQLRELELVLRELNQQGKAESDEAHMHRQHLRELQKQLQATESEFGRDEPGTARERRREDLEWEVQNLRKQMDGMNKQMSEMRELMKRLLEKSETPETL